MAAASGPGGRFDFDDGGSYAGDWSEGMAHGHGVCTGPRGEGEYAGAWQVGFETSGVFRAGGSNPDGGAASTSGPVYEGQWLQGRRHGLGVDSRGTPGAPHNVPRWLYRGEWTQGFRGRYGVRQSTATGTKYEGTWTAGLQDGYGVETYADGSTYQGQWLRGVRHGYGVRQSVSYEVALRYPTHSAMTAISIPVPGSTPTEKEDDILLRERDFRIEESRGGFVLRARTYPVEQDSATGKHRMILDKHGRPSLRKTIVKELRMIRQRSTGDLQDTSRSSSRASGSVRSTSSHASYTGSVGTTTTGQGSVYSEEGSEASFVSQSDTPLDSLGLGQELIERYLGEWKGDRRSGYGIAERTDGLRYEGEWANNRKHGYGVTILRDGARIEGKYKNNILVASVSGGKSSSLFALRSGKLRDRVDAAVKGAARAADIAHQKAEIANARMLSARMKAEQAEEVAKKAVTDADLSRTKARQYSPGSGQPGSSIIANRPTHETDLQAEVTNFAVDGYDNPSQSQPTTSSSPTKIFSFFKTKKTPSQQYVNTAGLAAGPGGTLQGNSQLSTLPRNNTLQRAAQASNSTYGGPTTNGRYPPTDGYGRAGFGPDPRVTATVGSGGTGTEVFETRQQATYQQSAFLSAPTSSARGFYTGNEIAADSGQGAMGYKPLGQGQGVGPTDAFGIQQQQQPNVAGYADTSVGTGGPIVGHVTDTWTPNTTAAINGTITPATTYAHGNGAYLDQRAMMTAESRRAAIIQGTGQRSFDDRLPMLSERRNSLPSIVKTRADVAASTSAGVGARFHGTTAAAAGGTNAMTATGDVAGRRLQVDTFVIENGVRKRVRSIYDETSAGLPAGAIKSSTPAKTINPVEAIKTRKKVYTLESAKRPDKGSVPDVSAISKDDILPREVVSVLSQRRREELIRQREQNEWRQRNQIVFQLGDMMDWCDRRRMLVFLIALNISLAGVFYTMLNQ